MVEIDRHFKATIILERFKQIQIDFPDGNYFISDIEAKNKLELPRSCDNWPLKNEIFCQTF